MKYTLEKLMAEVGCTKYPKRWAELFEPAMAEYDRQGCYLTNTSFYDALDQKYGCFEKYGEVYRAAAVQVAADEPLARFLTLLAMALLDEANRKEDLKGFVRPTAPEGKNSFAYEMVTGLGICSQLEGGAEKMRKRNIPENIIRQTLQLVVNGVSTSERKHNGAPGYELLEWNQRFVDAVLFQVERLQIEFQSEFLGQAMVFQNKNGEILSLANDIELHRDGVALGAYLYEEEEGSWSAYVEETKEAWIGYPYQENSLVAKEQVVLSKNQWKLILKKGDPVIRLHIPPTGKMTPEMIDKSIVAAKEFAKNYFPEYGYKAFACHSWLLDPQLRELLDKEANIVKFNQRFRAFTRKSKAEGVFNFVFNKPDMNFALSGLPENSSLERALKRHYLAGKAIYELDGLFI